MSLQHRRRILGCLVVAWLDAMVRTVAVYRLTLLYHAVTSSLALVHATSAGLNMFSNTF